MLEYRDFNAQICFDINTKTYYGWANKGHKVISFQAVSKKELLNAMQAAVHSILEYIINEACAHR